MEPSSLKLDDLLKLLADFFESENIPYCVVGSVAAFRYGEPRFTQDVDIVADIPLGKVRALCDSFPPDDFYVSESAVRQAIMEKYPFNIIVPTAGVKADIFIPKNDLFDKSQFTRAMRLTTNDGHPIRFATPEDIILKKLVYYQMGESQKHVRDILGILRNQKDKIDRDYIRHWVSEIGLQAEWAMILEKEKEWIKEDIS